MVEYESGRLWWQLVAVAVAVAVAIAIAQPAPESVGLRCIAWRQRWKNRAQELSVASHCFGESGSTMHGWLH